MGHPLSDVLSVGQQSARSPVVLGFEGTIIAGSYNPQDSTVSVVMGESLAGFDDPDQQGVPWHGTLMTTQVGDQYGPQGGERALLVPTRGGMRVILLHGDDGQGTDAPGGGVPVGERWTCLAKAGTLGAGNVPVWLGGFQLKQDAAATGDGLGSTVIGNQGAATQTQTAAGRVARWDDTTKTMTITSPTGHVVTIDDNAATTGVTVKTAAGLIAHFDDVLGQIKHIGAGTLASPTIYTLLDGAGNAISHVVASGGKVGIGALPAAANMFPAISKTDLTTMLTNSSTGLNIQRLVDMWSVVNALITAMQTSGVPSLPTLAAAVAELSSVLGGVSLSGLPSFGSIPVPSGSSVVSLLSP